MYKNWSVFHRILMENIHLSIFSSDNLFQRNKLLKLRVQVFMTNIFAHYYVIRDDARGISSRYHYNIARDIVGFTWRRPTFFPLFLSIPLREVEDRRRREEMSAGSREAKEQVPGRAREAGIFPYLGFQGQNRVPIRWRGETPRVFLPSRILIQPLRVVRRLRRVREPSASNKARSWLIKRDTAL